MNSLKGRIKYDRNTLILIGDRASIKDFNIAERGLPELAKDFKANNNFPWQTQANRRGPPGSASGQMPPFPIPPHIITLAQKTGMGIMDTMKMNGLFIPPPPPPYLPPGQPFLQHNSTQEGSSMMKKLPEHQTCAGSSVPMVYKKVDNKQLVVTTVNRLLDVLTPANYDNLITHFTGLPLEDKDDRILSVVGVVLEKALGNPSFSAQYANILKVMSEGSPQTTKIFQKQILSKMKESSSKNKTLSVEIQEVAQKLKRKLDETTRFQLKLDKEDKQYLHKKNSLATAGIASELCKLQLLKPEMLENNFTFLAGIPDGTDQLPVDASPASVESTATIETPGNENGSTSAVPLTGVSTCVEILDTEIKNAALTLQRVSLEGFDIGLEERVKLLKYIRECAQTLESLRQPGKPNM